MEICRNFRKRQRIGPAKFLVHISIVSSSQRCPIEAVVRSRPEALSLSIEPKGGDADLCIDLAVGIALGAFGKQVLSAQPEKVGQLTRTTLLKTVAPDARTEEGNPLDIHVFDVTLAAGGVAPRHPG